MKITIGVILILAAVDSITAAPPCNTTALSKLLVTTNVRTCSADSGYNPASMTAATDAQIDAVCNSSACTQAIKTVKQVAPNECSIGPIQLYAHVIDPLEQRCGRSSGSDGSGVAGSVSAPDSGSGPSVGNVGSVSDSVSGSVADPSTTNKSHTTSPRTAAPGNGGADAPTLSTCAAIAVAAVVAAIL